MGSQASKLRGAAKRGDEAAIREIFDGKTEDQRRALTAAPTVHSGKAAIHYASVYGHSGVIRLLIEDGKADPNLPIASKTIPKLRSFAGRTPIVLAAKHGNSDALITLAKMGANPDAAIASGFHALCISMEGGDTKAVAALLEAGANPRLLEPKLKLEPLQIAAAAAQSQMAEMLLDYGATPDVVNASNGESPLHAAVRVGSVPTAAVLLSYGADPDKADGRGKPCLTLALDNKDSEMVKTLAWAGADPRRVAGTGELPLLQAAAAALGDAVSVLLQVGADANAVRPQDGSTALHSIAAAGLASTAAELLCYGANPNAQRADGCTPLHLAAESSAESVATALCNAGGSSAVRDLSGRTPLHLSRTPTLSAMLLAFGGDANAQDSSGACPAAYAIRSGDGPVLATLMPYTAPQLLAPLFHAAVDDNTEWAVRALLQAGRVASNPDVRAASERVTFRKATVEGALYEVVRREGELSGELMVVEAAHASAHDVVHHARHKLERARAEDAMKEALAKAVHDALVAEYRKFVAAWEADMRAQGLEQSQWRPHGRRDPGEWRWPVSHHLRHLEHELGEAEAMKERAHEAVRAVEGRLNEARERRAALQSQQAAYASMLALFMSIPAPADARMIGFIAPQQAALPPREMRTAQRVVRPAPRVGRSVADRKAAA